MQYRMTPYFDFEIGFQTSSVRNRQAEIFVTEHIFQGFQEHIVLF